MEYTHPDKPTDAQIAEIQDLTNEKIIQNVPVETLKVDRKQAEEQYRKVVLLIFVYPSPLHPFPFSPSPEAGDCAFQEPSSV